jgi:hypothetical protein
MGLEYDARGRAVVDAAKVAEKVCKLEAERAADPHWRIRNLGDYARTRPTAAEFALKERAAKKACAERARRAARNAGDR